MPLSQFSRGTPATAGARPRSEARRARSSADLVSQVQAAYADGANVRAVQLLVGDDRDAAVTALALERALDSPRATLVPWLEKRAEPEE